MKFGFGGIVVASLFRYSEALYLETSNQCVRINPRDYLLLIPPDVMHTGYKKSSKPVHDALPKAL